MDKLIFKYSVISYPKGERSFACKEGTYNTEKEAQEIKNKMAKEKPQFDWVVRKDQQFKIKKIL